MGNIYILLAILVIINLVTFVIYASDKIKAVNHTWRISERILLRISIFGPFGAYLGMKIFRHKVKKPKFYVLVPLFLLIQITIILIIIWIL